MSSNLSRAQRFFAAMGAPLVHLSHQTVALYSLAVQTLVAILTFRWRGAEIARQMYLIGNKSLLFITVTLGFLGLITTYQTALQIQQIIPDFTMLGAAFLQLLIREFGPTIVGLMIATRVGSGIAAEIGSMVVTEQVDALRMCNADPVSYLIVPRTVACAWMVLMLSIYGVLIAMVAGMLIGNLVFQINYATFWNLGLVQTSDIIIGVSKALAYGTAIPVIAAQAGLETTGGSEGVGWATTRSVVNTSFAVIVIDFIISAVGYVVTGGGGAQ